GDEAVAQLEAVVYQVQDQIHQTAYALGVARPSSPWQGTPVAEAPTDAASGEPSEPPAAELSSSGTPASPTAPTAAVTAIPGTAQATAPAAAGTPAAGPTAAVVGWTLPALKPIG